MNARRALCIGLVAAVAAGSSTPAFAAKKKPKPIRGSYTAQAVPDPTGNNPPASAPCGGKLPTGFNSHPFKVPAKGLLHVELNNTLDWALAVRDPDGTDEGAIDGSGPTDKESLDVSFKKAAQVSIIACNNQGEPTVTVSYVFTYK